MTASTIELQERQVVNIADGKCLGNLKDIELNLWTGSIRSLVLPGMSGFWNRLQKSGELIVPWDNVVRIGVDVILIDMPEISQYDTLFAAGKRKKTAADEPQDAWQQEVRAYQETMERENGRIIVLNPEDYREV